MFFLLFCLLGEVASSNANYSLGLFFSRCRGQECSSFSSVYLGRSQPLMITVLQDFFQQMQRPRIFFLLFCVLGQAAASNANYSLGLQKMQRPRMFFLLFCVLGEVAASNANYSLGLQQMQRPRMFFLIFCVLGQAAASNANYSLGLQQMQRPRMFFLIFCVLGQAAASSVTLEKTACYIRYTEVQK